MMTVLVLFNAIANSYVLRLIQVCRGRHHTRQYGLFIALNGPRR